MTRLGVPRGPFSLAGHSAADVRRSGVGCHEPGHYEVGMKAALSVVP